jgi:AcrR family transcriptional regulator
MAQKRKTDQTKLITEAAIALADARGWNEVTFKDVARDARCTEATVKALFPDIWAMIRWHLEAIENETRKEVEEYLTGNWRDNLMEILMMRFERAQRHRNAWRSLPDAFRAHPRKLRRFARLFYKTMDRMLKLAGLPPRLCQPLLVTVMGGVYLSLVHTYLEDDTPDLARTMAAIDKRMEIVERAAHYTDCRKEKD